LSYNDTIDEKSRYRMSQLLRHDLWQDAADGATKLQLAILLVRGLGDSFARCAKLTDPIAGFLCDCDIAPTTKLAQLRFDDHLATIA
jgi:hypothetical protein